MDNSIASNVFGTLGAVFWSTQLIPQIIFNYRRHGAEGLSSKFMILWSIAGVPLGVYNITSNLNVALQVQAQILTGLSLVTFGQCLYYERKWRHTTVIALVFCLMLVYGAIEYALVFAVKLGIEHGAEWPKLFMGILAAVLLVAGVFEQYIAIYRNKSVDGISFLFCALDAAGDIASLISVAYEPQPEASSLTIYAAELACWMGIFAIGFYLKGLPKIERFIRTVKGVSRTYHGNSVDPIRPNALHTRSEGMSSSTSVFQIPASNLQLVERPAQREETI